MLIRNGQTDNGLIISSSPRESVASSSGSLENLFDEDVANKLFGQKATSMFKNALTFVQKKVASNSEVLAGKNGAGADDDKDILECV